LQAENQSKIWQTQGVIWEEYSYLTKWPKDMNKSSYEGGRPLNCQYSLRIAGKLRELCANFALD